MIDHSALLADIGGTNARFGIVRDGVLRENRVLACADFASPADAAAAFLADIPPEKRPNQGAFALAGPVLGDEVTMINRGWTFSIEATRAALGLTRLLALNDFTAAALSAPRLGDGDKVKIGGGEAVDGAPVAVLGPGSGLGVSGLLPRPGGGWVALSGEGGHATLAAADQQETEVLTILRRTYGHVSGERVLSGPGLAALYGALALLNDEKTDPTKDAAAISCDALAGTDPIAVEAVEMFCSFLGTVAGNLALTLGAAGGVLVAGGIAPRLGARFAATPFRRRFEEKGRLQPYMEKIPTFLVIHPLPAFLGLQTALED